MKIRTLPESVQNRIAAGEVVERPASAVKELVENSLDAGASRILVELEEGGLGLIRVTDDGSGMDREDAIACLGRHATSKLPAGAEAGGLFLVRSYGFRGEAIPSIASVSRFTLLTREKGALCGTKVVCEAGRILSAEDAAANEGTMVEVRDLFHNVPARRKFMKRPSTERAHAEEAVGRLALANPKVTFELTVDGRRALFAPAVVDGRERVAAVLGRELFEALMGVRGGAGEVEVRGFAAGPDVQQGSASKVYTFVNGRFVRDRALMSAVARAYADVLPHGRYPVVVLFLALPEDRVDVNVHPQKLEVRFTDGRAAFDAVFWALSEALRAGGWLRGAAKVSDHAGGSGWTERPAEGMGATGGRAGGGAEAWGAEQARSAEDGREGVGPPPEGAAGSRPGDGGDAEHRPVVAPVIPLVRDRAAARLEGVREALARYDAARAAGLNGDQAEAFARSRVPLPGANGPGEVPPWFARRPELERPQASLGPAAPAADFFRSLRFLGQLHRTYLVCEGPGALVLIDQHAAHERVAFEKLRRAAQVQGPRGQSLLFPVRIRLGPAQAEALTQNLGLVAEMGFEVEPFGEERTFAVRAVPPLLANAEIGRVLGDLADELSEAGRAGRAVRDAYTQALARVACHAAVRANDTLLPEEARALLDDLAGTDYGTRCPHGRPVVVQLGTAELERRFGRDYRF